MSSHYPGFALLTPGYFLSPLRGGIFDFFSGPTRPKTKGKWHYASSPA
jgi:hypothetical protein